MPASRSRTLVGRYRSTVGVDIELVISQYEPLDLVQRVVGVGSVGTRCALHLMAGADNDLLLLQVKEATESVLVKYGKVAQPPRITQGIEEHGNGYRVVALAEDPAGRVRSLPRVPADEPPRLLPSPVPRHEGLHRARGPRCRRLPRVRRRVRLAARPGARAESRGDRDRRLHRQGRMPRPRRSRGGRTRTPTSRCATSRSCAPRPTKDACRSPTSRGRRTDSDSPAPSSSAARARRTRVSRA